MYGHCCPESSQLLTDPTVPGPSPRSIYVFPLVLPTCFISSLTNQPSLGLMREAIGIRGTRESPHTDTMVPPRRGARIYGGVRLMANIIIITPLGEPRWCNYMVPVPLSYVMICIERAE